LGTATYNLDERVGHCFGCLKTIKFHSTYDHYSNEAILEELGIGHMKPMMSARQTTARDQEIITPRPLGEPALAYIRSRGIADTTITRLPILQETTYREKSYLAWKTLAPGYELRAIDGDDKRTPMGHHKYYSRAMLQPKAETCIVAEGVFSALSYAQLFQRFDVWYLVLNSTSNTGKLLDDLDVYQSAGISQFILALDNDPAGKSASETLKEAMTTSGFDVQVHLPEAEGLDWNDVLVHTQEDEI
jgi:hypothetical protein